MHFKFQSNSIPTKFFAERKTSFNLKYENFIFSGTLIFVRISIKLHLYNIRAHIALIYDYIYLHQTKLISLCVSVIYCVFYFSYKRVANIKIIRGKYKMFCTTVTCLSAPTSKAIMSSGQPRYRGGQTIFVLFPL